MNKRLSPEPGSPINSLNDPVTDAAEAARIARDLKEQELETIDTDSIDNIVLAKDLENGGFIRIERRGPGDVEYKYVTRMAAEQWKTSDAIEMCQKLFGGGDYQCRTFKANGKFYKMFKFGIDHRYRGTMDEDAIRRLNGEAKESGRQGTETVMLKMLEALQKPKTDGGMSGEMLAMLEKNASTQSQSTMMMVTMMIKSMEQSSQNMMTMMAALIPAMMNNKGSDQSQLLLELIKQNEKKTPINETLALMAQIKDIFDKPEPEDKDDMWGRIGKIAGPVLQNLMGGQPAPAVAGAPPQPGQLPQPAAGIPQEFQMMLAMGLRAAEKNSDPGVYFELLMDQLTPAQFAALQQNLTAPDWCVRLFGNEQQVAHVRPWLDALREMILTNGAETTTSQSAAGGDPGSP